MQTSPELTTGSKRRMRWALLGSAALVIAGLAAFTYASRVARHAAPTTVPGRTVTVTVRDGVCDPAQLSVPAGRTTFTIVNQSARTVEWEILDGVMVLEERENIAPGFSQTFSAKLSPGVFQITCGLLSNPRGTLTVTPSAESDLEAARPPVASFVGPLAEYRVYTVLESGTLIANTRTLVEAIRAGDLAQARSLYAPAHEAYGHIAPAAALFADLDTRLNARAVYFEKREADPAFSGFHRLAHAMFTQNSLEGLAPVATQLLADVEALQARLRTLQLAPERLAGAASRAMQGMASGPVDATHEPDDLTAPLEGVQKIVEVLRPLLAKAQPALLVSIDAGFAAVKPAPGATTSAPVPSEKLQALATDIAKINPALGLE